MVTIENNSLKLVQNSFLKNRYYVDIILICVIIILNVFFASMLRDTAIITVNSWYDDAYHLNVANNLRNGNGFVNSVAGYLHSYSFADLIKNFPNVSNPFNGYGPIYHILLAGFLIIISPDGSQLYYTGSIFNTILTSCFFIIYFIFSSKYFGRTVAFFSSLVVVMLPNMVSYSVHVLVYPVVFIFIISALFFLKQNTQNYFLFGLFSGLAHLVHPLGVIPAISYSVFLLSERKFKGALIVFGTSTFVLIPWMIRNILTFDSLGKGFAIPFASRLNNFFNPDIPVLDYSISENIKSLPSLVPSTLETSFNYALSLFNVHFATFLLILAPLTIFALFNYDYLKSKKTRFVLLISAALILYLILTTLTNQTLFIRLIPIGIILPLSVLLLFFRMKNDFQGTLTLKEALRHYSDPIKFRLYLYGLFFGIFTFLGVIFLMTQSSNTSFDLRLLFPIYLIFIPFVVFSLKKVLSSMIRFFSPWQNSLQIFIVLGLILIPFSANDFLPGIESLNNHPFNFGYAETESSKKVNDWIFENLPQNSIIATNSPSTLFLTTGMDVVQFPIDVENYLIFDQFINHYEPNFFVSYGLSSVTPFSVEDENFPKYVFTELYSVRDNKDITIAFKILNIDELINKKFRYITSTNNALEPDSVIEQILYTTYPQYLQQEILELEEQRKIFESNKQYSDALIIAEKQIQIDPTNLLHYKNKIEIARNTENYELMAQTYHRWVNVYYPILFHLESIKEFQFTQIQIAKNLNSPLLSEFTNFEEMNRFSDELIEKAHIYAEADDEDKLGKLSYQLTSYCDVLMNRSDLFQIKSDLKKLIQSMCIKNFFKMADLYDLISLSKQFTLYNRILEIEKFNAAAILGIAENFEMRGMNDPAIHNYELALSLGIEDSKKIENKIIELKS